MNAPKIDTNNMMLRTEANENQGFTDRNMPPKVEFPIAKERADMHQLGAPKPGNTHHNIPQNVAANQIGTLKLLG